MVCTTANAVAGNTHPQWTVRSLQVFSVTKGVEDAQDQHAEGQPQTCT